MDRREVLSILEKVGAFITGSHIVYTSGNHGEAYVDKDMIYPHTMETSCLCRAIAENFTDSGAEAVVAPEKGGIILSQWVAHHLSEITDREVLAFYAEKTEDGGFTVKRGGAREKLPGKKVLVVEDIITTGSSVKKVVEVVRALDARVIGVGALCHRGDVTSQYWPDVPRLSSLVSLTLTMWKEADCPLCKEGVPINIDVGKGQDFLARKAAGAEV